MKLHHLLAGIAASALMAGAAHAQLGAAADPEAGVTPNQGVPADVTESQTGLPSVDSTRPTGADAGKTNLPAGEVSGSTDVTTSSPAAATDSSVNVGAAAATSAGVNASTGANVQLITNGPIPDTPENRDKYGDPMSNAGKRTAPAGN